MGWRPLADAQLPGLCVECSEGAAGKGLPLKVLRQLQDALEKRLIDRIPKPTQKAALKRKARKPTGGVRKFRLPSPPTSPFTVVAGYRANCKRPRPSASSTPAAASGPWPFKVYRASEAFQKYYRGSEAFKKRAARRPPSPPANHREDERRVRRRVRSSPQADVVTVCASACASSSSAAPGPANTSTLKSSSSFNSTMLVLHKSLKKWKRGVLHPEP